MKHFFFEKIGIVFAGIVYFLLAMLCYQLSPSPMNPSIWLANSVLLVFIFRSKASDAGAYCLVGLLANLTANHFTNTPLSIAIIHSLANNLEVLIPVMCTPRNPDKPFILNRLDTNTYILIFSIIAACMTSAIVISNTPTNIFNWFTVDMLAFAVIVPLGLSYTHERLKHLLQRMQVIELLAVITAEAFIILLSDQKHELRFVVVMIPLLYAAIRLGVLGNNCAAFAISAIFVYKLIPFDPLTSLQTTFSFALMCITLLPSFIISLLINQHNNYQQALQKSERRWKYALESGNQGVWDWRLTDNTIYYSKTWKTMFGFSGDGGIETPSKWLNRIHPNDKISLLNKLGEHLSGNTDEFNCEHRMLCENDSYKWVLARGKVISKDKAGKAFRIIGTHTDIDAIKQSQEEIKLLSNRLQLALDTGKIGIFDYNIVKDTLIWDQRMYEIYGVGNDDFSHTFNGWKARIYAEDLPKVEREFHEALTSEKHLDIEFRIINNHKAHWIRATALVIRDLQSNPVSMLGMNWDITDEKDLVQELQTEKERLSTTLHSIGDAVIVTNEKGVINFINPAAEHILATNSHQAIGRDLYDICKITSETTDKAIENPIISCLNAGKPHASKQEGILTNKNDTRYFIQNSTSPIILPSGKTVGCIFVFQDITSNRNLQSELKHQATHDVLTGLLNRREMEHRIEVILSDARISKQEHALLFIDLDKFKNVNDSASHAAGDELLRRVANLLNQSVRTSDYVARLGGDEFAIILPNCTLQKTIEIANLIIDKIRNYTFYWQKANYNIDASIGITTFTAADDTLESILNHADIACYNAKNKGGGVFTVYEKSDQASAEQITHNEILPKIKAALTDNTFKLYAQEIRPVLDVNAKPYYELLLRLPDTNGKHIPTSSLFKVADRQHLLIDIDKWVCRYTLIECAELLNQHPTLRLSINISSNAINSANFHQTLANYLTKTNVDLSRIGFEMKEAAFLNDVASCQEFMQLVLKYKCFISMDSFRKGLSAFQYLENIPELYIKIDRSFIQGMIHNKVDLAIVESINKVAHNLGAKTVAEFVESTEIFNEVKSLGIDYAQGFLIAEAVSLHDIIGVKTKGIHYES